MRFPGSIEATHPYRLLDGYDGWNYLAVAITENTETLYRSMQ